LPLVFIVFPHSGPPFGLPGAPGQWSFHIMSMKTNL
jgi:hypothetical protein